MLVFVHPGGYQIGSAAMFNHVNISANFVSEGIIFVTLQYRLGPLGEAYGSYMGQCRFAQGSLRPVTRCFPAIWDFSTRRKPSSGYTRTLRTSAETRNALRSGE